MKLEAEFNGLVYPYLGSSMLTNEPFDSVIEANSKECAKIAENFAIGFSEWLMVKCDYRQHCVWEYQGDEYTQKELLEIYKKQL